MTSQAIQLPSRIERAFGLSRAARDWLLAVRPLYVLSSLLAVQWLALVALALTVRHNGWIYYQGGDQLWHYTSAYLLAHGQIAPTLVGVGWSTILAPITWFTGKDLVSALPLIVLFNALVLVPVGLACMYGIGARIGGRLFGYWAALLWVVIPYVGIPYALHGYHQKWTEITLPQVLGLTAMADLPSVVALLVGAYLCMRAVEGGHWLWAAAGGFAVGYSLVIKPSNAAFLFAPGLLFLIFRWRALPGFVGGLIPPLLVLGFWKERGYGRLPAFARAAPPEHRVAAGVGGIFKPLHKYTGANNWTQLHNNLIQLREFLWSDRLLEFLVLAGIVALLIRSRRAGLFVGAWFVAFLLLKGTYLNSRVEDATFWRLLLPAFPAFVLLVASVPLLIPGVRLRPAPVRATPLPRKLVAGAVAAALALLVLFPLALVAAARPIHVRKLTAVQINATLVPIADGMHLAATRKPNGVLLSWKVARPAGGRVFYRVYRSPAVGDTICVQVSGGANQCRPTTLDIACRTVPHAPDNCIFSPFAQELGATRQGAWLDRPPHGAWTYRVGLSANWLDNPQFGDVYVFSRPVTVSAG